VLICAGLAENDTSGVSEYNRAIAIELAEDLVEIADVILASVKDAEPAAPPVDDTCRSLVEAIKSLVPILKPWPPDQTDPPARRSTARHQTSPAQSTVARERVKTTPL
jgi:hypothetical protein